MSRGMERVFDLIEYKTGLQLQKIAENEGMTPQNLARIKREGLKSIRWLVELVEKYDLDWNEVIKGLQKDYGNEK
jgi:hypothetical protein